MNASVLTEGNFDGMLLGKLIADEQEKYDIEIRVVGGKSSIYSFARTLLAVKRIPVAIVIDADSPEQDAALERQLEAEEVIGNAAAGLPFRVIVAVPELEILFFQRLELLRRVYGEVVDEHLTELAQLSPRRALMKLAPDKTYEFARMDVLRAMNDSDVQSLRESPLIQDLLSFLATAVLHPAS